MLVFLGVGNTIAIMHVTPESAGLIAQVFPTLMIALLIEGRLTGHAKQSRWFALWFHSVRLIAMFGAGLSTFVCLQAVALQKSTPILDVLVTGSLVALLGATSNMIISLTRLETSKILGYFTKPTKVKVEAD